MADLLKNRVCIIDNGTGYTKMGWAGNTEPQFDIPTVIADHVEKQKVQISKLSYDQLDFYIGNEALGCKNTHNITYPMRSGVIENWELMEKFWHRSIFDYMRAEPDETVFILTEPPMVGRKPAGEQGSGGRDLLRDVQREGTAHLGAGGAVAVLELVRAGQRVPAEGRPHGDGAGQRRRRHARDPRGRRVRDRVLHQAHPPRRQGHHAVLPQHAPRPRRADPAGGHQERRLPDQGSYLTTYGYVVEDGNLINEYAKYDRKKEIAPGKFQVSSKFKTYEGEHPITKEPYQCDVGYERFLGPEMFFHPEFLDSKYQTPIDETIEKAIQGSPIDYRRKLYNNIVLSGGSTLFEGFAPRLESLVQKRIDMRLDVYKQKTGHASQPIKVNVTQNPFQRYAVWQGGSFMGIQPQFEQTYHSRQEYMEIGPQIARHNAVFNPGF